MYNTTANNHTYYTNLHSLQNAYYTKVYGTTPTLAYKNRIGGNVE